MTKRICINLTVALVGVFSQARLRAEEPPAFAQPFTTGAVATDHPLASKAGAEVLAKGGTAADAAAAAMLALGVVSPASSGLGGGGFALYYKAKDKTLTFLDFRERAPGRATPQMFAVGKEGDAKNAGASTLGGLAVAVPGEPLGIEQLLKRFGRLDLFEVVDPAHRLAELGFPISAYLAKVAAKNEAFMRSAPAYRGWFKDANTPLAPGQLVRNRELGKTLKTFAQGGSRSFYHGAIAKRWVKEVTAAGGVLSLRDLEGYRVIERELQRSFGLGYNWITAPLPSAGGYTLLSSVAFLEQVKANPKDETAWSHALAESWKGPFVDRIKYLGDPDFVQVPLVALKNAQRLAKRAGIFDPKYARPADAYAVALADVPASKAVQPPGGGTSHLCVVDREGNVAAITTTVNLHFGAQIEVGGLPLNNEMDDFARALNAPNAFGLPGGDANLPGPGKRPVSTMTPSLIMKGDVPVLCVGGSGGSRIVTATEQVALNVLVRGMSPEAAMQAPRLHHQAYPPVLEVEAAMDPAIKTGLERRGHQVVVAEPGRGAIVQFILLKHEGGFYRGGVAVSDPRKGGAPAIVQ